MRRIDAYCCTARVTAPAHWTPASATRPTGSASPWPSGAPSASTAPGTSAPYWSSTATTGGERSLIWRAQKAEHRICLIESHLNLRLRRSVLGLVVRQDHDGSARVRPSIATDVAGVIQQCVVESGS